MSTVSPKAPTSTLKRINGIFDLSNHFTALNKGRATTGKVMLYGARVGDTIVRVMNLTGSSDKTARFEATISVADQIQMTNQTDDLSAAVLLIVVKR